MCGGWVVVVELIIVWGLFIDILMFMRDFFVICGYVFV